MSEPLVMDHQSSTDILLKLRDDFQQYMYSNAVLRSAAGFCIGMATKEGVDRIIQATVQPSIIAVSSALSAFVMKHLGHGPIMKRVLHAVGTIAITFIDWVLVIVVAFVAIEYFLNRSVVGMSSVVADHKRANFEESRRQATPASDNNNHLYLLTTTATPDGASPAIAPA